MIDKNKLSPEVRQQLYGGEISDYYREIKPTNISDNKALGDIYDRIKSKNNLRLRLNSSDNLNNKLQ